MSIVVRFSPANLTAEQYDQSVQRLEAEACGPRTDATITSASAQTATSKSAKSGTLGSNWRPSARS
jgi:hypothetical protein